MPESHDDLEAVRSIVDILEPFDSMERERILRWSSEKSGLDMELESGFISLLGEPFGNDIMAMLFYVYRESILEQNKDKQYYLEKIKFYNTLGEHISDYLKYLHEVSKQLNDSGAEKITVELRRIGIETKLVGDASTNDGLDNFCERVLIQTVTGELSADQLRHEIANVDKLMESARNEADKIQNRYQGWDQKANQLYQLLSTVLRAMRDMRRMGESGRFK